LSFLAENARVHARHMAPNRCQLSVPAAGLPPVLAVCVIAVTQAAESATQVLRRYSCSQDARVPLVNFGNGSKAAVHANPTARGQTRPVSALKRTPRSDHLLVSVVPKLADLDPDLPFTSDRF